MRTMDLTPSQIAYIRDNYGGTMSSTSIDKILNLPPGFISAYIKRISIEELTTEFKHIKREGNRQFYDPLIEPDMTPVDYSIKVIGNQIIYTFQSRINY